jgi:HEAT repeat protein
MRSRFSRLVLACPLLLLAGCSSPETKQALTKANDLSAQQKYDDANVVLIDALRAREAKIRSGEEDPGTDPDKIAALAKKVQSDPEILRMERAQLPLYLHLDLPNQAAAVDNDILVGAPTDDSLAQLLQDKDSKVRINVVRTLGLVGGPTVVDPLITAAKDVDEDVRSEAISSLGLVKDPKAVPVLIHALNDSYWFVRSQAADALEREKDPSAIEPLLDTVSDPDANVEGSAENALANLCQLPGVSPDIFAKHLDDANAKIAIISTVCLAVMKDKRATPILIQKASSPDTWTRLHAVQGLGETGDPAVIPTLRTTLKDPEVNVRGWSIIGLDNLKDTGSIDALRALADDPSQTPHIRQYANLAVSHLTALNAAAATSAPQ